MRPSDNENKVYYHISKKCDSNYTLSEMAEVHWQSKVVKRTVRQYCLWISLDTYRTCDYLVKSLLYCMLFSSMGLLVLVRFTFIFSVCSVTGYAHVFVLVSVVLVYRTRAKWPLCTLDTLSVRQIPFKMTLGYACWIRGHNHQPTTHVNLTYLRQSVCNEMAISP